MSSLQNRMTSGKILPQLIKFALPVMVANFLQQFYGIIDMLIVGRFTGSAGLSAVSTGSNVTFILTFLCTGLTIGGEVLVAQHVGANDDKGKSEVIGTLFTMCIIAAFIVGAIALALYKPMLSLMNTPPEALKDAEDFALVSIFGVFFIFGYNSICSILRGIGDSKRPMYFIGISSIVNIALVCVFVGPLNMRALGAGLATVIAQGISCVVAVVYLYRRREYLALTLS